MEQYGVQDQWMSGFVRWSDIRKGRCSLVVVLICAQGLHCAHTRLCIREWGRGWGWGVANRKGKKIEGMAQGWSKSCVEQRWKHHGFIIVYKPDSKIQLSAAFFLLLFMVCVSYTVSDVCESWCLNCFHRSVLLLVFAWGCWSLQCWSWCSSFSLSICIIVRITVFIWLLVWICEWFFLSPSVCIKLCMCLCLCILFLFSSELVYTFGFWPQWDSVHGLFLFSSVSLSVSVAHYQILQVTSMNLFSHFPSVSLSVPGLDSQPLWFSVHDFSLSDLWTVVSVSLGDTCRPVHFFFFCLSILVWHWWHWQCLSLCLVMDMVSLGPCPRPFLQSVHLCPCISAILRLPVYPGPLELF